MAGPKSLRKLDSASPELNKVQEYVQRSVDPVSKSPIIDGTILRSVELKAGQNNDIDHRLGRPPRGWVLIRLRADSRVWDDQDKNTLSRNTLRLLCSSNVTVDLWVF